MAKQIRLTTAEARAAGLLDPEISHLVARTAASEAPAAARLAEVTGEDVAAPKKKRRRSKSRPAAHPSRGNAPCGAGSVTLDAEGRIATAEFVFDVVPVPKERARVVKNPKTGGIFGYTPARTKHFSSQVARVVKDVFLGRPPVDGPVRLDMTFVMEVPKSWPKWKRAAALEGLIVPTGRPDMDNLEKALLDAFNGVLIVDDAYVIDRRATKIYGETPAIHARVEKTGQAGLAARRAAVDAIRRLHAEEWNDAPFQARTRQGKTDND